MFIGSMVCKNSGLSGGTVVVWRDNGLSGRAMVCLQGQWPVSTMGCLQGQRSVCKEQ